MRGWPRNEFWGKFRSPSGAGEPEWHPLIDHCADVAACVEAFLERPVWRARLARAGGRENLEVPDVQRLAVLGIDS